MNNSKLLILVSLTILLGFMYSCGSRRTFEKQPPQQRLAAYPLLEIPDFRSQLTQTPDKLTWNLPNQIEKKLKENNLFVGVSRSPLDLSENVLILQGTITEISPIEWYKQILKSITLRINIQFIEKTTGNIIADVEFEGEAKWGIFGGTRMLADIRVVDEIVAYIEKKYR